MPSSNGSLDIAIELKAKQGRFESSNCRYKSHEKISLMKLSYLSKTSHTMSAPTLVLLPYRTSLDRHVSIIYGTKLKSMKNWRGAGRDGEAEITIKYGKWAESE
jgi:hypothetical protein